ncbi:MAG TPA: hypothetical protein VKO67_04485, partial [Smithellaceae bacterium]|nr:hypothetical protein [Smithellaceae bacterium]
MLIFLVLFCGRMALRYILQKLNTNHLQAKGKDIPAVFADQIDAATFNRMVDYTLDQARLESRENLAGDVIELAVLFLLLPILTVWLAGLNLHLIVQALIFFAALAVISGAAGLPFDLYHTFVLERRYSFSTITRKLWLVDFIKSVTLSAILMAIIVGALMAFITY